jgi:MFS family permease
MTDGDFSYSPPRDLGPDEKPRLWTGSFVTFLFINLCIFMGFNMLLPTLTIYLEDKGLVEREIGIVYGSFTVSAIFMRLFCSPLSARFGSLWVARFGLFVCSFGTLFYFLYNGIASYLFARLMQGAGFGLTSTLLVSLASQSIPHSRLAEGLGYLGLGATVSLALGPYAGIFVAEEWSFEFMFVSVSVCYLLATMVSFILPKSFLKKPPKIAYDSLHPKPPKLETKAIPPSALMAIYGMAVSSIVAYLAIYAKEASLPSAAVFFMVSTIGTVISRLYAGRIYDHYGHKYVIPPAIVLMILAVIAIISNPSPPLMYSASVLYGLGAGAIFPSLQTLALTSVSLDRRTVASAYFFVAFDLGIGLGAVCMGVVAGFFHTYRVVFLGAILFLAVLFVVYFLLYRKNAPKARESVTDAKGSA